MQFNHLCFDHSHIPVSHFPVPILHKVFHFPLPFPNSRSTLTISRYPFLDFHFPISVSRLPFPISHFPFANQCLEFEVPRSLFPFQRSPFTIFNDLSLPTNFAITLIKLLPKLFRIIPGLLSGLTHRTRRFVLNGAHLPVIVDLLRTFYT